MPYINMRGLGLTAPARSLPSTMSPVLQQALQQQVVQGGAAQQVCSDPRYSTPALQSSCIESAAAAAQGGLNADQLYALVTSKVKCHTFFDSLGIDADMNTMASCIASPDTVLRQLCAAPGASGLPACAPYLSFTTKYKKPLLIGGGIAALLLILKVVL